MTLPGWTQRQGARADCGGGQYEAVACDVDAAVQRECRDTERGHYSPAGDNEQTACTEGVDFASAPGAARCTPSRMRKRAS